MRLFRQTYTEQDAALQKPSFLARFTAGLLACGRGCFLLGCMLGTAWLMYQSYPKNPHAVLAWFALAPFVWGVCKIRSMWCCALYGWLMALLFNAGIFYWIYYTCPHGGGLSNALSLAA